MWHPSCTLAARAVCRGPPVCVPASGELRWEEEFMGLLKEGSLRSDLYKTISYLKGGKAERECVCVSYGEKGQRW